jgi:TetR/AcrR family transcriptional regulator, regulator of cefoperazone and chloramphenicol sensitivity
VADRDRETRDRLFEESARLFAAKGFDGVTVRDICKKARANVAAVNYHFGGKSGLYEQVLRAAIQVMQGATDEMRKAGEGRPPDEQLEWCVRIFVSKLAAARESWIHQLMLRELAKPTPAFELVMTHALKPRMVYVRGVIAGIMETDADDPRVGRCLMSVQAQLFMLLNTPPAFRIPTQQLTPERLETMAAHITRFSIAGIREVAAQK